MNTFTKREMNALQIRVWRRSAKLLAKDTVMTLVFKHLWISRRLLHYSKVDLLSGKDSFQVLVTQA
jgi:hypothetical protein